MSAFEVSDTHIDALVSAALAGDGREPMSWHHGEIPRTLPGEMLPGHEDYLAACQRTRRTVTLDTAGTWGATLLAENRRSVNHRYDEDEYESPYQFSRIAGPFSPVAILKALNCYEYQSCEHPEWEASEAFGFCQALRALMIRQLPGYRAAAFEINDPSEATTGVKRQRGAA